MVLTQPPTLSRRALAALVALTPLRTPADTFGSVAGYAPRIEGLGGGADVLTQKPSVADVAYPPSLLGYWRVERQVVSVEGDAGQAQGAWLDLGGGADFRASEVFYTRFVPSPKLDGALVADRGFEIDSRLAGATVGWQAAAPDALSYVRRVGGSAQIQGEPTELAVVERSSDLSDAGFGFNELVRVSSAAGGLFGGAQLVKAARVKRKFRRAYADDGTSRQIEGLEIMTTYRCLDGVCGVEMPTSTTKSTLRLTRPTVAMLKAAGVEEAPSAAASSGEVL